jgi:hypothetical protein
MFQRNKGKKKKKSDVGGGQGTLGRQFVDKTYCKGGGGGTRKRGVEGASNRIKDEETDEEHG